jgi:hypothetical protein
MKTFYLLLLFFVPKQADDVELWRDVFLGLGERDELELVECPVESGFVWGRRSRLRSRG